MTARSDPSWLTAPFWELAGRGVLSRQRCRSCGHEPFPPQFACPACLGTDLEWVVSSGRGRVYSFTVVHLAADGRPLEEPSVIADIDLEEGWHLMSNVVGCDPAEVEIGLEVVVTWQRLTETVNLPYFTPASRTEVPHVPARSAGRQLP